MKCSYCNTENPEDELFCLGCGSPLREVRTPETLQEKKSAPIVEIQCPHCGKTHPSHLGSCPETGRDLPSSDIAPPAPPLTAKLVLPDGSEIRLPAEPRIISRYDFDRFVSAEDLQYISKQQFTVSCEDGNYFIEDNSSKNGTLLNGAEIKNQGRQPLKSGDQIELGKVLTVFFKLS